MAPTIKQSLSKRRRLVSEMSGGVLLDLEAQLQNVVNRHIDYKCSVQDVPITGNRFSKKGVDMHNPSISLMTHLCEDEFTKLPRSQMEACTWPDGRKPWPLRPSRRCTLLDALVRPTHALSAFDPFVRQTG